MPLPPDIALADMLPRVHSPGRMLRIVLYNLEACSDRHGSAYVRLGTAGAGFDPSHVIVFDAPDCNGQDGTEQVFGRFDNSNGDLIDRPVALRHWSTTRTSLAEVERLMDAMLRRQRAPVPRALLPGASLVAQTQPLVPQQAM